ncbi:hypothetical protein ACMFMG_005963 [Clarireedia jacksonii]
MTNTNAFVGRISTRQLCSSLVWSAPFALQAHSQILPYSTISVPRMGHPGAESGMVDGAYIYSLPYAGIAAGVVVNVVAAVDRSFWGYIITVFNLIIAINLKLERRRTGRRNGRQ